MGFYPALAAEVENRKPSTGLSESRGHNLGTLTSSSHSISDDYIPRIYTTHDEAKCTDVY